MKQISASIVVLAAAIVIVGSSHFDERFKLAILGIGIGVCVVGLRGWFISMKEK
jgi:ABC-type enterobactin transport system permease subunit